MTTKMDRMVTSIQTTLDTTMDKLNTEVTGYIKKRTVSRLTWVGFALLSAANFMSIITFSTPGWAWTEEVAGKIEVAGKYFGLYGVWYICWTDLQQQNLGMCDPWSKLANNPSWIPAFQGISVMVLILGLASFFVQLAYICIPSANKNSKVLLSFVAVVSLTAIFTCTQWIIFITGFLYDAWYCCKPSITRQLLSYSLYYCFIISCVCSGLYFLTALISMYEWLVRRKRLQQEQLLQQQQQQYQQRYEQQQLQQRRHSDTYDE